ncbi:MAG: hypothetical protein H6828_00290 [Planctomycetes bacterium]|nr:hypothetical protein [Planctomycetota bacterium]
MHLPTLALATLALKTSALAAPSGAELHLLPLPPGFQQAEATDCSADGQVLVGTAWPAYEAFRWSDVGGYQLLGVVPGVTTDSTAQGVSGDGRVVVGWGTSPNVIEGFRWEAGTGMTHLPALGGQTSVRLSSPACTDRTGAWVGGYSYDQDLEEGTLWPAGGAPFSTGFLSTAHSSAIEAVALDAPVAVGWSTLATFASRATSWDPTNGLVDLGVLSGFSESIATAVSHDGTRVLGSCSSATGAQACAWTAGGGLQPVGAWPSAISLLFVRDADATAETFVGTYRTGSGATVGFYYSPATGVVDLAAHLAANGVSLSGVQRLEPYGMSADGNVVVGRAVLAAGGRRAFRARFAPVGGALLGSDVCAPSVVNSVGKSPDLAAYGSPVAADGACTLFADDLPPGQNALFVVSAGTQVVPSFLGGAGTLCLAQPLGRLGPPQLVGPSGELQRAVDLGAVPTGAGGQPTPPGTTWHFQLWYRDGAANVMNFTSARSVTFQ